MVTLPPQFVATRVPGYFCNTETRTIYSIKTGVLRQIKGKSYYSRYYMKLVHGWAVSHQGVRLFLDVDYVNRLVEGTDSVIKVARSRRS